MRAFFLTTLLPILVTSSPLPGLLLTPDGPIIVARDDLPEGVASPRDLEERQASATANDLVNGKCAPVTVIYARGTVEAGNIGAIVGPPLRSAIESKLGADKVAFQGVNYAADIAGFLAGGDSAGAATMASLANRAATQCPQTQIVMSGYSQGAQVVSKATAQLGSSVVNRIKAVVLFGNPNGHAPVPNISADKTKIFCADGDLICAGTAIVLLPHFSYGADTPAAAQFIASKATV